MSTDVVVRSSHTTEYAWPCPEFFEHFRGTRKRLLLLDYDGTLAPFSPQRNRAFPYPMIPELLAYIMNNCNTRVVLISGRGAREIPSLLGLDPHPEIRGSYGLEQLHANGRYIVAEIPEEARRALAEADRWLRSTGLSNLAEIKTGAIAIHDRALSPAESNRVKTAVYQVLSPLALEHNLLLQPFDGGMKLRAPIYSKGDVVNSIISEYGPGTPVAYLGDDLADEDAFRALYGRGLSVLVRPRWRFTAAQMWLRPPQEVMQFLNSWTHACGGEV